MPATMATQASQLLEPLRTNQRDEQINKQEQRHGGGQDDQSHNITSNFVAGLDEQQAQSHHDDAQNEHCR
jgi:hypothetical protein